MFDALARERCLVWHEGVWVAASPSLVMEVMTHPACRVRPIAEPVPAALAGGGAGEVFGALVRMNDGQARHAVPKMALQRALAGVPLEVVAATAGRIARDIADVAGTDGGRGMGAVAVTRWMAEVPVRTVASLLGFGDAQLPALARSVGTFVACLSPLSSAEQIAAAQAASEELTSAVRALVRTAGGAGIEAGDAVAHAVGGAEGGKMGSASRDVARGTLLGQVLSEAGTVEWREERAIVANLVGLLSQTYEATAGLIGNTLVALQEGARWPRGQGEALALVREVAWRDPAVQNTRRFVAEDAHVGGVDVKKGQAILVVLAAASRAAGGDQAFGFGHGAHKCPGQAIAETIAASAIASLPGPLPRMKWRYRASVNARIPEFMETE